MENCPHKELECIKENVDNNSIIVSIYNSSGFKNQHILQIIYREHLYFQFMYKLGNMY